MDDLAIMIYKFIRKRKDAAFHVGGKVYANYQSETLLGKAILAITSSTNDYYTAANAFGLYNHLRQPAAAG